VTIPIPYCIGDAFGHGRKHKTIQAPHDIRHIGAFAGEPCQLGQAGLLQHGFALGAQRAVTHHHQAQPLAQRGRLGQRLHEGALQHGLGLHGLHAAHGAGQPQGGVVEGAAGDGLAAPRGSS
jgi:hypothetical protein